MTIDMLIEMLEEVKKEVGGDAKVLCHDDEEATTINVIDEHTIEVC